MTPIEEGKLIATVDHLTQAVEKLTTVVERLESQKNYWRGAISVLILMSAAVGFGIEAAIQWFHR